VVSPNPQQPGVPHTIEAQAHVRRVIDELRALGGEVRITVDGKPVARFLPIDETNGSASLAEAVEFIERFGDRHTLGREAGLDWKMLRDEGRR
jgi:antitoxin (DNA-binding transcriptional repressor) of toxin-antitoxin stability system